MVLYNEFSTLVTLSLRYRDTEFSVIRSKGIEQAENGRTITETRDTKRMIMCKGAITSMNR